jgi:hypothetical protein
MRQILRAGIQRIENGIEVQANSKEFVSKSGRKCYLSGISNSLGKWVVSVRYLDNGEFIEVDYDLIKKYL